MKNVKKIILLILITFFLCGCSGTYKIKYNKDMTIEEELNLKIENKENIYDNTVRLFEDNRIDKNNYKIINDENVVTISYNEKYDNFEDYLVNSKLYKQFYNNIDYTKEKNNIKIKANNNFNLNSKINDNLSNSYEIDYLGISLETPFKVNETNADEKNENTYTWIYKSDTIEKNININFELKENNFQIQEIITILVTILAFIIILIIIVRKYIISRKI